MRTHAERSQVRRRATTDAFSGSPRASSTRGHPPGSILHLQRTVGNRATARRLRTPELVLGSPGDRWEREAEREADRVLDRPPDRALAGALGRPVASGTPAPYLSPGSVRTRPSPRADRSPAPVAVADALRTPGRPLEPEVRAFFEPRFGRDLGSVRAHTDRRAARSAEEVGARAYTVGRHVVFGRGEYRPHTDQGRRLIAHELVHTFQQGGDRRGGVVRRQGPAPPATLTHLTARREAFNNSGNAHADNCAAPAGYTLGVDQPALGLNAMEMIFRISGQIPPGTEFEITRTVADGLWERVGGNWTRLGGLASGTSDDRHDDDECQRPASRRIFVIDNPGLRGTLNPRGRLRDIGPVTAAATAAVWVLTFAEWVMARNRSLGIGWTRISQPTFHRWHSIFSVELVGGTWTRVDTPSGRPNEIELGSTSPRGATP